MTYRVGELVYVPATGSHATVLNTFQGRGGEEWYFVVDEGSDELPRWYRASEIQPT